MQIGNLTWVCCNYDGNGKYNNINFSQSVAMVKRILSNLENSVPINYFWFSKGLIGERLKGIESNALLEQRSNNQIRSIPS